MYCNIVSHFEYLMHLIINTFNASKHLICINLFLRKLFCHHRYLELSNCLGIIPNLILEIINSLWFKTKIRVMNFRETETLYQKPKCKTKQNSSRKLIWGYISLYVWQETNFFGLLSPLEPSTGDNEGGVDHSLYIVCTDFIFLSFSKRLRWVREK